MEPEKCIEVMKNKLRAIIKTIREYNEKIKEDRMLKTKIIKYALEHNISNIPLLRRFANPIKDPDPLASTMIALSYKFPIMIKTDKIRELKLNEDQYKEMIEPVSGITRKPGWTGCKKEAINQYLNHAPLPSKEISDIVSVLYHVEDQKAISYNNIVVDKVMIGMQFERREKIKLQIPLINDLSPSDTEQLIIKILSPEQMCSTRIQEIYEKNKDIFYSFVPEGVTLTDQASALRAILDSKERYVPILQSKFPQSIYQHCTSIFSNYWQAESIKTEKGKEIDIIDDLKYIETICKDLTKSLYMCNDHIDIESVCRVLLYDGISVYDIIDASGESNDVFVNYIKSLLRMRAYNCISYRGNFVNCVIGFNDVIEDFTMGNVIHIKTSHVSAVCHMQNDTIKLNIGWTTYSEIKEIYILCKAIQNHYFKKKQMIGSIEDMVKKYSSQHSGIENNIFGKFPSIKKNIKLQQYKMQLSSVSNISIAYEKSPDDIILNEIVAASHPLLIASKTEVGKGIISYTHINKKEIMNVSHFICCPKSIQFPLSIDEDAIHFFKQKQNYPFLQCIEIQKRFLFLIRILSDDPSELTIKIDSNDFYPFYNLFDDWISEEVMKNLCHSCFLLLAHNTRERKLQELPPEIISFWYIFQKEDIHARRVMTNFSTKNGNIIDLDFNSSTQTINNALWIDDDNNIRCFSHYLKGRSQRMENYMKIMMTSTKYPGYRMEVYDSSKIVPVHDMKAVMHKLSTSNDPSQFFVVQQMGILMKVYRDTNMDGRREISYSRALRSLKRSVYIDKDGMQSFCSKKRRLE